MLTESARFRGVRETRSTGKRLEHDLVREILKEARLKRGVSTRHLSAKLQKAPTFIARVERGERLLDIVEFIDVFEELDLNPSQILSDLISKRGLPEAPTDSSSRE